MAIQIYSFPRFLSLTSIVIFLILPFWPDTSYLLLDNWDLSGYQATIFFIFGSATLFWNFDTHWKWDCLAMLVGFLTTGWHTDPLTLFMWNGLTLFTIIVAWLTLFGVFSCTVLLLFGVALLFVDCCALLLVFCLTVLFMDCFANWKLVYLANRF